MHLTRRHVLAHSPLFCLCAAITVMTTSLPAVAGGTELIELQVDMRPTPMGNALPAAPRDGCPPATVTHSSANFSGGSFVIQGGFVEGEIAAVSYTISASDFPITINTAEMVFAQNYATVTTTTYWSLLVWEGVPSDSNQPIRTFSSDGTILPHIVMQPGPNPQGVMVSVSVDPSDAEQIIVQDNGSHTFSVGFRIDQHNQPASGPCCFGVLPQHCCPAGDPPCDGVTIGNNNAFPTVDTDGAQHNTENYLYCMTGCGALAACSGWNSNAVVGMSGDWNIRATYTPFDCPGYGACCSPATGTCTFRLESECQSLSGNWQGDGTSCTPNPCPQPTGACCRADGSCDYPIVFTACLVENGDSFYRDVQCEDIIGGCPQPTGACCSAGLCYDLYEKELCDDVGGVFLGFDSICESGHSTCNGACCNPYTGFCTVIPETQCLGANEFQGPTTTCVGVGEDECPSGSCCNPDGSCTITSPAGCVAPSVYTEGGTCGPPNPCPQPVGACCFPPSDCAEPMTSTQCAGLGGVWAGVGSVCSVDCVQSCPADKAPGDLNADGIVDAADIQGFVDCLLGAAPGAGVICDCGDFSDPKNGVDSTDLDAFVDALLASS